MEKPIISLRVDDKIEKIVSIKANETKLSQSEVYRHLIQIGIENTKSSNEKFIRLKKLLIDEDKFRLADAEIRMEVKKAFMYQNFKKLISKLRAEGDISPVRTQALVENLLSRMKEVLGEESKEFKEAKKWLEKAR